MKLWESKLVQAGVYDYPNQAPVHGAYTYPDITAYNYLDNSHHSSTPSTLLPSLPNPLYSMVCYPLFDSIIGIGYTVQTKNSYKLFYFIRTLILVLLQTQLEQGQHTYKH